MHIVTQCVQAGHLPESVISITLLQVPSTQHRTRRLIALCPYSTQGKYRIKVLVWDIFLMMGTSLRARIQLFYSKLSMCKYSGSTGTV